VPPKPQAIAPVTANRPTVQGSRSNQGKAGQRHRPVDDEGLVEGFRRRLVDFGRELRQADQRGPWIVIAFLTVLLIYSYWPGLLNAQASWSNPQYSHGWIVPIFSTLLLFWWRRPVDPVTVSARLAGLALLVASFALRLLAARYRIVTIDMYTFVPALLGIFLLAGGWSMFRWAWAPLAFLIFMYPLPDEATRYLLGPLQTLATIVSTFALQTIGIDAFREGNQIVVGEMHLGVVDACSGLRMLTIFVALSVALVLLGDREWWENLVVLASAIPIALIVNSIRITVTGLLYQVASSEVAEMVFHDLAGWVMMPMALGMLFLEQQILSHLFVTEDLAPAPLAPRGAVAGGGALQARQPLPPAPVRPSAKISD
jgi:exosortase